MTEAARQLLRRIVLLVVVMSAGVASSTGYCAAATVATMHTAALPVVRCPTEFGVSGPSPRTPATVTVSSSSTTRGSVAYTNTQIYLVGPRGMRCSGIVAVDGGSQVVAWPQGHSRPGPHARTDGLTLSLDPACVSCKADDACPFFTALARDLGFPCTGGVPAGERVYRLTSDIILFEDPPGVAGSGWPSGGHDPANGLVGHTGSPGNGLVYRSTCTLPASDHSACTTSLNDVIRRYG
jgi:hypothetical protein